MPTALYDKGREAFGLALLNWPAGAFKAVLIDAADYTVNLVTDENLDDIPAPARVSTAALAGKTFVDGIADATDTTFLAVAGDPVEALVIYLDTGVEATSKLVCYIDNLVGFPYNPSGVNVIVSWNNGANKIFKL
jgi:hypothetical protein